MRTSTTLIACLLAACGGGGGGPTGPTGNNNPPGSTPQTAQVQMRTETDIYGYAGASSFNPASVTIARGASVTWTNSSGATHNVTFEAATGVPADVGDLASGTASRTFSAAGTFRYSCTNHSGMSGMVNVQ